ncbi:MAG: phytase [Chitinophagaceae bacterium]|nr:MAG: phytase [Chitinophagaceae bacterium]
MRLIIVAILFVTGCRPPQRAGIAPDAVKPVVVTEQTAFDTDDPAIWINRADPSQSLIIGTDKETGGGLYAYNLQGKVVNKVVGLQRPNNVDVAYGFRLGAEVLDLAICTERGSNSLRFYTLPQLIEVDGGGLPVFEGEADRQPMGVAVYTHPADHSIYLIVGRKSGPADGYLWQYRLADENGKPVMQLVRKFGKYSGKKEIESIAVDNELGYVYYSDEQFGIRKYFADPAKGNEELAVFGQGQFREDNEGISVYKTTAGQGYILVSDQSANTFNVYRREGESSNPHQHDRIAIVPVSTRQSDGSDVTNVPLPGFPRGMFVAMSDDRTFQLYNWDDIGARIKAGK